MKLKYVILKRYLTVDKLFWIEEGRLAGRCGPSVAPLNLQALKSMGFRFILCLDPGEYEKIMEKDVGLEVILMSLPSSIPPKPEEVIAYRDKLPKAVSHVLKRVSQQEGALLVLCHAGNDRTGGVLTGYLSQTRGITPQEALTNLRKSNPHALTAPGYEAMILSLLA